MNETPNPTPGLARSNLIPIQTPTPTVCAMTNERNGTTMKRQTPNPAPALANLMLNLLALRTTLLQRLSSWLHYDHLVRARRTCPARLVAGSYLHGTDLVSPHIEHAPVDGLLQPFLQTPSPKKVVRVLRAGIRVARQFIGFWNRSMTCTWCEPEELVSSVAVQCLTIQTASEALTKLHKWSQTAALSSGAQFW